MNCPKCEGEMEEGTFIADRGTPGQIPVKFATGFKGSFVWGYTVKNKLNLKVMRCNNCGYLENYAK